MSSVSSMSVTGKKMCSNSLFIRGANGELAGLLCINFDSSRYEELAGKVMDLCGGKLMPGTESGTSLIVDRELPSAGPRGAGLSHVHRGRDGEHRLLRRGELPRGGRPPDTG